MAYGKTCAIAMAALEWDIIQKFTCPTCLQYIKSPPIKQCMVGHIYCSACFDVLSECWLCAGPKADIKCTVLEKLQSTITFPCEGYRRGCRFTGKSSTVRNHENSCLYTTVCCPSRFAGCCWIGNESELPHHLTVDHPENMSGAFEQEISWVRNMEANRMQAHVFSACGRVFQFSWIIDDSGNLLFGLNRMGDAFGKTCWSYKIAITHAPRSGCSMTINEPARYLPHAGQRDWLDLWTGLDTWCWRRNCNHKGDLHFSLTISKLQ